MEKYVRRATEADAVYLAPRLREADVEEIAAAGGGKTPLVALLEGVQASVPCFTMVNPEGNPCGMFGVVPAGAYWGRVWMLAGSDVERWPVTFLKRCRQWVRMMNILYPLLFNVVYTKNTLHVKWLKWCGFGFMRKVVIDEKEFQYFLRGGNEDV